MNLKHRFLAFLIVLVTAAINVVGADVQTQSFVIASASLDVGDVVQIPGPQIADAIRRIYRSGLFS
ncbi:MAG: hypothetical protein RL177_1237, partial [Bacteroidota bacterium]